MAWTADAEPFGIDLVIFPVLLQFSQSLVEISSQFAVLLESKAVGFGIHGIPALEAADLYYSHG